MTPLQKFFLLMQLKDIAKSIIKFAVWRALPAYVVFHFIYKWW